MGVSAPASVPNALALLVVGFFSVSERHAAGLPLRAAWFDQPGPFRSTTIAFVQRGLEEEVLVLAAVASFAGLVALLQLAAECREETA